MLGVLLLSGSFFLVILFACLALVVHIKNWTIKRDDDNQKRFEELTGKIDDTQRLFRNQVTDLLTRFDRLLDKK